MTLVAFTAIGALLLLGQFRSTSDILDSLSTASGLGNFAGSFLLVIGPAGLPAALAGAMRAAHLIHREPTGRTFGFWARHGLGFGSVLGAANAGVWFAAINIGGTPMRIGGLMALVGAGAGAAVGLLVAAYCWRRRLS
jgi:hypothetical protein